MILTQSSALFEAVSFQSIINQNLAQAMAATVAFCVSIGDYK